MREMKDSGIEWIGAIPKHWEMIKMKYLFKIIGSGGTPKTSDREYYDGEHNWLQTGDLNDGEVISTSKTITQKAVDECSTLVKYKKGSLVIALYGATIGKLGILDIDTYTNQACCVMQEPIKTNMKFVYYWLLCNRENIINMSLGGGQPNISQGMINSLKISVPKRINEQNQIADYLDKKCAEIDGVIKGKEDENKALEEYRKSVIYEAVINNHNGCSRKTKLKFVCEFSPNTVIGKDIDTVSYVPMDCLKQGYVLPKTVQIKEQPTGLVSFANGDIIMARVTPCFENGNIAIVNDLLNGVGVGSSELFVFRANKVNTKWLFYLLHNHGFIALAKATMMGVAGLKRVSPEMVKNYSFSLPSVEEQQQIVDYLDKKCEEIDTLIKTNNDLIDNLKQYKKSIIFEAVTGKTEIA